MKKILLFLTFFVSIQLFAQTEPDSMEIQNRYDQEGDQGSYVLGTELQFRGQTLMAQWTPKAGEGWKDQYQDFASIDQQLDIFAGLQLPIPISDWLILSMGADLSHWLTMEDAEQHWYYQNWLSALAVFPLGEKLGLMGGAAYDMTPHGGEWIPQGGLYWNPQMDWSLSVTALYPLYLGFELESPQNFFYMEVNIFTPQINLEIRPTDNWTLGLEYIQSRELIPIESIWNGTEAQRLEVTGDEFHLATSYDLNRQFRIALDYCYAMQKGLWFVEDRELNDQLDMADRHSLSLSFLYYINRE